MTSGLTGKKRERYEAILDAAIKVFAEHGYHSSQVSRIAREAGVADGTIYLYFKNKEDILVSLIKDRLGKLVNLLREQMDEAVNPSEALAKVCQIHFGELEQDADLAKVTQVELRQSSIALRKEIGSALKPYIQLIEEILCRGMASGEFRANLDVKLTRHLIFGALDEVVTSWLIAGQKYSLLAQAAKTTEFFWYALRPQHWKGDCP